MQPRQSLWPQGDISGHGCPPRRGNRGLLGGDGGSLGVGHDQLPMSQMRALRPGVLGGGVLGGKAQQVGERSLRMLVFMLSSGALGLPSDRQGPGSWWPVLPARHCHCHSTAAKEAAGSRFSDSSVEAQGK